LTTARKRARIADMAEPTRHYSLGTITAEGDADLASVVVDNLETDGALIVIAGNLDGTVAIETYDGTGWITAKDRAGASMDAVTSLPFSACLAGHHVKLRAQCTVWHSGTARTTITAPRRC
jgi:hypothetical protein